GWNIAGFDGRPAPRLRHAGTIWLLRRVACGRDPVRPGRHEGGGAQPHEILRGRELRPVHAVPGRHRKGGDADGVGAVERSAADRAFCSDARRFDLRPRPGGAQSAAERAQILPRGAQDAPRKLVGNTAGDAMSETSGPIKFTLDGREVEAPAGETIFRTARRYGIELPNLCYSPAPGYRPDGNCRVCMVEIEGERVLAASCIRTPTPGMKVNTQTDRAKTARRMVIELLLTDQPPKDVAHDPQSEFWETAERHNVVTTRFP